MRISELISFLRDVERERGDIDVAVQDEEGCLLEIHSARIGSWARGGVAVVELQPMYYWRERFGEAPIANTSSKV